jgi:phage anti-repressor protein
MNELITVSKATIGGDTINTVNARDIHSFLVVGQDFSTWIKRQIERARLVEDRDFITLTQKREREIGATTSIEYFLTLEAGKHIAMLSGTDKGFEVREYFIECERAAKQQLFKLPATYAEALRALADETDRREHAERTKAEIGTRREATAMNTASQLSKKVNALEIQLDKAKDYASIKRMSALYHGLEFNWRELKSASSIMGLPPLDIFDANFGSVKSYHRHVWIAVYALDVDGNPASAEVQAEANSTITVQQSELN